MLIAIDGPSGSGKSSTSRAVAKRLGLSYLDTGAIYRALSAEQLRLNIDGDDSSRLIELAREADFDLSSDPDSPRISINGVDVTETIREPSVSAVVSQAATIREVRNILTDLMRAQIERAGRNIVVEGRDITTVVAPDADVKVLLTARAEARMARRHAELGSRLSESALHDQIVRRDKDDSTVSEFMEAAAGVHVVDSTSLSLDEVIEEVIRLART